MRIRKIFKAVGKNFLVFLVGAIIGIILAIVFVLPPALEKATMDLDPGSVLGLIALIPLFIFMYGFFGLIIGGFAGIIIYNAIRAVVKRKKPIK